MAKKVHPPVSQCSGISQSGQPWTLFMLSFLLLAADVVTDAMRCAFLWRFGMMIKQRERVRRRTRTVDDDDYKNQREVIDLPLLLLLLLHEENK